MSSKQTNTYQRHPSGQTWTTCGWVPTNMVYCHLSLLTAKRITCIGDDKDRKFLDILLLLAKIQTEKYG